MGNCAALSIEAANMAYVARRLAELRGDLPSPGQEH